jgi:hypothetical protein
VLRAFVTVADKERFHRVSGKDRLAPGHVLFRRICGRKNINEIHVDLLTKAVVVQRFFRFSYVRSDSVDPDEGFAIIAQCYIEKKTKASAKANKASDINTAVAWLL